MNPSRTMNLLYSNIETYEPTLGNHPRFIIKNRYMKLELKIYIYI